MTLMLQVIHASRLGCTNSHLPRQRSSSWPLLTAWCRRAGWRWEQLLRRPWRLLWVCDREEAVSQDEPRLTGALEALGSLWMRLDCGYALSNFTEGKYSRIGSSKELSAVSSIRVRSRPWTGKGCEMRPPARAACNPL